MAGTRGPIGKRDEERVRRNVPDNPTETVVVHGAVKIPEMGDLSHLGETHPLIIEMYESIKNSAAVRYYEPTDWTYAKLALYTLNQELIAAQHNGKPVGAMKLTAINQMLSALLLTEGDRRRVRLEIERKAGDSPTGEVVDMTSMLKQRLAQATANGG
ncbi:terminase small subunit [Mycobacterium phage Fayely]|uniref:minor tail protein n=1 Tax=Mycobacterium phage Pioneer TaxID=1698417 RepID=UPI0006BC0E3E|nr:minor tail protein [Mycobacterium phage Pioneer]AVI04221.1 terminase small subunit [Mycobacterium phage Phonnegut]AVI04437.1 terminase small subunit [Mycobacterium phage Scherzo]AZF93485.1 terminase small subunit [Mycobacterium phage ExplosioNervosa]QBI96324.1 terminase small subunit [Mycobacterium phage Ugenie5]QGJ88659.1 terminase small subunit [Mycobacterium phage Beemo]UVF60870.1 terminase small subunit [Mycobacterium phage Fayely]